MVKSQHAGLYVNEVRYADLSLHIRRVYPLEVTMLLFWFSDSL